ncbi:MAG: toll/interleukin-1 receptor domain-containing protein [Phototrophicaceae bacterium]
MNHIFISYSRQDIDFARYTRALLESYGFWVWMDEKRLSVGMDWWDEIETNIDNAAAFLVIMSPDARDSIFVRNEILRAIDQKKPLFPVLYRGSHFGMLAYVQHEDMRAGLNATFSNEFINSLRDILGFNTKRTIRIDVRHSAIENFEADVLLHKLAPGSGGLDPFLISRLKKANVMVDENALKEIGDYLIVDSNAAVATKQVAFIKTQWVGGFGYRQVREFANRGLSVLGTETPQAKHIIMTIHGVNTRLRLDQGETMLAQLAGLVDVLQAWQAPIGLERITIVEFEKGRMQRIRKALQDYFDEVHYAQPAPDVDWGSDLTFERESQVKPPDAGESDIKPYALALFPEEAELEDIFYYGIERPVHAMGLLCERLNPYISDDDLESISALLDRIKNARLIVCDVTTITPLLYLQLGYAWGANIPTILITRQADPPPELGEVIQYEKIWQLEERLSNWIKTLS